MLTTTLSLTALLSIMGSFQGALGLPATSSASLSPESTASLDGLVQATPTSAVPLAASLNSTVSPPSSKSEPNDSFIHISSRDQGIAWAGIFDNEKCKGSPVSSRPNLTAERCSPLDINAFIGQTYLGIFWGSDPTARIDAVDTWRTRNCDGTRIQRIVRKDYPQIGPGSCVNVTEGKNYPFSVDVGLWQPSYNR
ncbi:hypothetical protein G7Y79_00048g083780 [Physcia stellaris]|nr:hypothetical protein G7Y79_00048g083780 [Physcia stellaris]